MDMAPRTVSKIPEVSINNKVPSSRTCSTCKTQDSLLRLSRGEPKHEVAQRKLRYEHKNAGDDLPVARHACNTCPDKTHSLQRLQQLEMLVRHGQGAVNRFTFGDFEPVAFVWTARPGWQQISSLLTMVRPNMCHSNRHGANTIALPTFESRLGSWGGRPTCVCAQPSL